MPDQLDPQIKNLALAIREIESGGNYGARGKSGEYGAYQFMSATWRGLAAKYLGDANADITDPRNQNKVVYSQLLDWKNAGNNIGQIASMWNAGEGRPNAYIEGNKGVNSQGVSFDTAAYANKVATAYHLIAGSQPAQAAPAPTSEQPSLISSLRADYEKRTENVKAAKNRYAFGQQGFLSTVLQGAGEFAGAAVDTATEVLKAADRKITGGKITGAVETAVDAIAETPAAKAAAEQVASFSNAHPVAAENIEALLNIASVLPVGKAAKAVGDVTKTAAKGAAQAAAPVTEKAALAIGDRSLEKVTENYRTLFQSTKPLKNTFDFVSSKGIDPAAILTQRRLLPEISNGRADFTPAIDKLEAEVAEKSTALDKGISKYPQTVEAERVKKLVSSQIASNPEFKRQGRVPEMQAKADKVIDNYVTQEGTNRFNISQLQSFKKGQYELSSRYRKAQDYGNADDHSAVAAALRQVIEKNTPDLAVRDLNKQIGALEDTITLLERANGAVVKGGSLGTYVGEFLGAIVGSNVQAGVPLVGPLLGALGGRYVASQLQKGAIAGPVNRLLMRLSAAAPDNELVQKTLDFVAAVERGEKVLPDDAVLEFLAQISARTDIPLLPAPVQQNFKSIIETGRPIGLPEKTQSTIDAIERTNANIKQPE